MDKPRNAAELELAMDIDMNAEEEQSQSTAYPQQPHHEGFSDAQHQLNGLSSFHMERRHETINYKLSIIIDTNILLEHLNIVIMLRDKQIAGCGYPILVIPWIVIEELDALKTLRNDSSEKFLRGHGSSEFNNVEALARTAINFLYRSFESNHPRIRGQCIKEIQEQNIFKASSNDDHILQCCLLYQKKAFDEKSKSVLFSNDKNLCTKALINGIKTFDNKTISDLIDLGIDSIQIQESDSLSIQDVLNVEMLEAEDSHQGIANARMFEIQDYDNNWHTVIDTVRNIIEKIGSVFVISEFTRVFNEVWIDIVAIKPPWNCHQLLYLLQKHWIAVFGNILAKDAKQFIDLLHRKFGNDGLEIRKSDVKDILRSCFELLKYINCRPDYMILSRKGINVIKHLQQVTYEYDDCDPASLKEHCSVFPSKNPPSIPSFSFDHEINKVKAIFNQIWNNASSYSDFLLAQLKIDESEKVKVSIKDDLNKAMPRHLIDHLHSLISALVSVQNTDINYMKEARRERFVGLQKALLHFMKGICNIDASISVDAIIALQDSNSPNKYFQHHVDKFQILLDKIVYSFELLDGKTKINKELLSSEK